MKALRWATAAWSVGSLILVCFAARSHAWASSSGTVDATAKWDYTDRTTGVREDGHYRFRLTYARSGRCDYQYTDFYAHLSWMGRRGDGGWVTTDITFASLSGLPSAGWLRGNLSLMVRRDGTLASARFDKAYLPVVITTMKRYYRPDGTEVNRTVEQDYTSILWERPVVDWASRTFRLRDTYDGPDAREPRRLIRVLWDLRR